MGVHIGTTTPNESESGNNCNERFGLVWLVGFNGVSTIVGY